MDDDAADVLDAAHARARALADADEQGLRDLLHPAFGWISHAGAWFDRDAYVAANCRGGTRWLGQEIREPRVAVVGDIAVLRCLVVDTVEGGASRPETFVMPITQTWIRADGRWRCLAGHAGPRLAAPEAATA
jgi:hypothetical protein